MLVGEMRWLMREKAKQYLEYFDFKFLKDEIQIRLNEDAPRPLSNLVTRVCESGDETLLTCIYETLNCIADADALSCCEIDEKVCPEEIFRSVLAELDNSLPTENQ
ncbi:hypothetical protein SAMN05660653_00873 [Desulfonatronum thiosulfatophilum]|uniref:Uncharacterized protein n=1 Tax=Desulfonatronum thiosulfatophilum TaxID=617002 RepID=A0A1G6BBV5_9BACT|nr:hypothetical protein [Desulfonatronum thiosulfatophilum]SDB18097.1 hypothetical protein SAMN05660653_00873 [Desulfonatronum thiosulfatophilum]